jgi:hypothetical protein
MSGMMGKLVLMLKKAGYLGMQYFYTILQWTLRFFKVQLLNLKKKKAQKNMEKAYSGLGAEVYSLYKQGDQSDWRNMPAVQQELREIEEAESKVFQVDEGIDEVNSAYLSKKEEIREKYSAKRATADVGQSETFD